MSEKSRLVCTLIATLLATGLYLPLVFGMYNWGTRCLPVTLFLIAVGVVVLVAAITATVWLCRYRKKTKQTKINSTFRHHPLFPTEEQMNYHNIPYDSAPSFGDSSYMSGSSTSSKCCCTATTFVKMLQVVVFTITVITLMLSTSAYFYFSDGRRGPVTVKGITDNVEVLLSKKNVLHINAQNRNDAMFVQGLLTAEMRLWQMELQRRLGQGRLSEFVGHLALPTDKMMRTLGFYDKTLKDIDSLDTEAYEALESYVKGVNAYIDRKPTLPLEMQLLGYQNMEKWTMADSLVWSKIMSYDLSGNLNFEIERFNLLLKGISIDRIEELLPKFNTTHFPTVLTMEDIHDGKVPVGKLDAVSLVMDKGLKTFYLELQKKVANVARQSKGSSSASFLSSILKSTAGLKLNSGLYGNLFTTRGASNNWVVGPSLTRSNKPILCNDPHLQLTAPSIWIMTHINIKDIEEDLWGASFVGLPGIVIGRNSNIAWGVTNTAVDVQDLYILKPCKENPTKQYMFNNTPTDYVVKREEFKVLHNDSVFIDVRWSTMGPVVTDNGVLDALSPDNFEENSNTRAKDLILALKWVSIDPKISDTTFMSFLKLNTAKNYSDFRNALTHYVAPAQNFIFADNAGNFGYQMPGKVPKRAEGHTGKLPVPGYDDRYTWRETKDSYEFMDFDNMPRTYNPSKGFVASANNKVTPVGFEKKGYLLSHDWDASLKGYRAKRITHLIEKLSRKEAGLSTDDGGRNVLTTDDMRAIQLDYQSGWYDDFSTVINEMLDKQDSLKLSEKSIDWAVRMVDPFSGDMNIGSREATVFAKWMGAVSRIGALETGKNF